MPIHRTLNQDFFKNWSPEMAYVLGFFTADGNMNLNKITGGKYLEFTSNDYELIERVKKLTNSHQKISTRVRSSKNPHYRIQIGSVELFNDLIKLGLTPNKSKTIRLPQIPSEFFMDFARGYFDGDGCAHLGKHWAKDRNKKRWVFNIRFASGSHKFLEEFWERLKEFGVTGGYIYEKKKHDCELVYSWLKGLELCHILYHNVSSDMYLKRKYDIYQKALKVIFKGA